MSVITIDSIEVNTLHDSYTVEDYIEERSTCSFTIVDKLGNGQYRKGQPVTIAEGAKTVFIGVVDTAKAKQVTPSGVMFHEIDCVDNTYYADKRIIAKAYENQLAGDIVKDIVTTKLADEGIIGVKVFTWNDYKDLTWEELINLLEEG